jgi:pseudaminic acid synthase
MGKYMINHEYLMAMFNPDNCEQPFVCVEMSGNHQGNFDSAMKFVRAAKSSGADLLKLQVYRPDTITLKCDMPDFRLSGDNDWAQYGTLYELYEKAHTPWDWVAAIFEESKKIGLPVFASPFDLSAVNFLEELGCPFYKVASPEITDLGLIEACARTGKPVIISTGLASRTDLDEAVAVTRRYGVPLMLLKCVSAYPTPIEDINLATIPWLKKVYGCAVGLSDHTLGPEASYGATAMGAAMIEKHFKLPGDITSVDAAFSMPLDELKNLKTSLSAIYASIGIATLDLPASAKPSLSGRRSLYAVANISAGQSFTPENVKSIRPCFGLHPKHLPFVLKSSAARDIVAGERMTWALVNDSEKFDDN